MLPLSGALAPFPVRPALLLSCGHPPMGVRIRRGLASPLAALAAWVLLALAPRHAAHAADFGPSYLVERIVVRGNGKTADGVILRQLLVHAGDVVGADDGRVEVSRFRVLALGFFSDVQIRLERGGARGRGVLVVEVVERGTVILNQLFLGTSEAVPLWGGVDFSENNFVGRGIGAGAAFVFAEKGSVPLARPQRAFRLRVATAHIAGTPFSAAATLLYNEASEPFRIAGRDDDGAPGQFIALPYRRIGGLASFGIDIGAYSRLAVGGRYERVQATLPGSLVRTHADGRTEAVVVALRQGDSDLSTLILTFERDTRSDPVLPLSGSRIAVTGEMGSRLLGSSYDFYKLTVQYQGWFRLPWGHVISALASVGAITGDPPLFDRYYLGDLDPLVPGRPLGLSMSTQPSRNFLGAGINRARYGTLAGIVGATYLWPLFRGGRYFYGGHLFAGGGAVALAEPSDARYRDLPLRRALPIDLYFDGGFLLDTYIGIFNLSIANFLGRLPL